MKAEALTNRSFRSHLQEELVRRCKSNQSYSLRSYARALGVSSSALSAILNGKRPLTKKSTLRLGSALGLKLSEIENFTESKAEQKAVESDVQQLTLDTFAIVSDWYHFAILELIRVKGFKPDAAWIARSLGLSRSEVNIAVERLQRVNLLTVDSSGKWRDNSVNGKLTNINGQLTDISAKQFQRQILEKAAQALQELPTEVRSHTGMMFAVSPKDLPDARKRIQKFRRELAEMFERSSAPEHVYQLAVALYPLTQINESN